MAKSREQKEQAVEMLTSAFSTSKLAVLTDYRGLNVVEISALRSNLREEGINYMVAKNTLIKLALANNKKPLQDDNVLTGPVGLAFGQDEVSAAKIVYDFAKTNKALEILGAIDEDGKVLSQEEVVALAKLPSRLELTAQVVGTIAAPLSGMIRVLGGNLNGLVYALKAVAEQKS